MFTCRRTEAVQYKIDDAGTIPYERCHFVEDRAPGRQIITIGRAGEYELWHKYAFSMNEVLPTRVTSVTSTIIATQKPGEDPVPVEHPVAVRLNFDQAKGEGLDRLLIDKLRPATSPGTAPETEDEAKAVVEAARQNQREAGRVAQLRMEDEAERNPITPVTKAGPTIGAEAVDPEPEAEEPDPVPETKAERKVRKAAARKAKADAKG